MLKSVLLGILGEKPSEALNANFFGYESKIFSQMSDSIALTWFGDKFQAGHSELKPVFARLPEIVLGTISEMESRLRQVAHAYAFTFDKTRCTDIEQLEEILLDIIVKIPDSSNHVPDMLIAIVGRIDVFSMEIRGAAREKIYSILGYQSPQLMLASEPSADTFPA